MLITVLEDFVIILKHPLIRTPLSVVKKWPYKRGGLSGRDN
jgi:hypothetical protein